jgi:hypothetical protein
MNSTNLAVYFNKIKESVTISRIEPNMRKKPYTYTDVYGKLTKTDIRKIKTHEIQVSNTGPHSKVESIKFNKLPLKNISHHKERSAMTAMAENSVDKKNG